MSKNIAARTAVATAGLALAATGVLASPGTASAGTNGQQISYTDHATPGVRHSIELYGYNQNGEESLGCFNIDSGGTTKISGWWWRGDLTVKAYNSYDCQNRYSWGTHVAVPYSQSDDWFPVTGY
ncbi:MULTISPECIES: hypothetical protein [Streptomyces]|uniref:Secreted protein n=2 Tax=Streptomyces TaxID=1883 RepID=A0A2U9PC71_STRAS|nr:hypothetical protein [Streptomyces actuosus]AWT47267.1 hypothetical protein DMT42_36815 [Streptomyces actuosus]MBM4823530.1 hypothetical protein [Streptomyces actuosus]